MSGRGNGPRRSGRTIGKAKRYNENSGSLNQSRKRAKSHSGNLNIPNVPRKGLQLNTATSDEIVATNDVVYFSFGRFQPPTRGHKELIDYLESKCQEGADAYLFVSSNEKEPKRNPLTGPEKLGLLKKMYPGTCVKFITAPGPIQAVKSLRNIYKHQKINMVFGDDHAKQSKTDFDFLTGPRYGITIDPPMPREIKVISGTKLRELAIGKTNQNTKNFSDGIKTGNMTNENVDNLREVLRDRL